MTIVGVLGLIAMLAILCHQEKVWKYIVSTIALWAFTIGLGQLISIQQQRGTAIECHKGNNPYEMKVLYDENQCPVDTLYIKK